jgi:hypothetical protein
MKIEIVKTNHLNLEEILKRNTEKLLRVDGEDIIRGAVARSSDTWAGVVDKEVACVWGLIPPTILGDKAYLWLITTDLVDQHPFCFVRHSQMAVQELLKQYPIIYGHVIPGNERGMRWLKWLGARITKMPKIYDFELRASNG